ncbi:unnamed protein product [Didymodactylos carnosus]|uniref:Ubiquitin-like domain-containing protein n=1 Tax=Didymodactylos carnosus TaxID=1234261 RepID=A0A813RF44_9BILA|nr:unnamed protein product [Didymodactylos carnosus]CAF0975134.1 unnamed protein product [Didymodactylos carnosus]CAF3563737.1 unnamed protein product [Didymodactylos carnosus]CAF3745951.1 unnamed protein product [Didymodactylos carnosus]
MMALHALAKITKSYFSYQLRKVITCKVSAKDLLRHFELVKTITAVKEINLKLLTTSGKTAEFLFSPSDTAADVSRYVYENWPESWNDEKHVERYEVLRLIYQGRFLHGNVTLSALRLQGKTTVMHLVPRENLPDPVAQDQKRKHKAANEITTNVQNHSTATNSTGTPEERQDEINSNNDDLHKELEGMDNDERLEYVNKLSTVIFDEIIEKKNGDPSKWESYWEKDENDIEYWSEKDIRLDPVKGLLTAVENGKLERVKDYVEKNFNLLTATDSDGYTPLHRASSNNHIDITKYLIEKGANVNLETNDKWTCLHCACFWNNADLASLLIQNGANVNAQTNGGQTSLHLAASQTNHRQVIQLLLMNPFIDVNIKNNLGETAGTIATRSSSIHCLFDLYTDTLMKLEPSMT